MTEPNDSSLHRVTRMPLIVCRPKSLPLDLLPDAARRAAELNPANALDRRTVLRTPVRRRGGPRRIAVMIASRWPATGVRLSVSFMDNPSRALRARILQHMNAWNKSANVLFSETQGTGQVRISRLDTPADMAGYWSYIGTDILSIPDDEPTMNLEGFTMRVSDAEFRRVVRHEAGHTLGFEHEHMRRDIVRRIDRKKAIAFFDKDQGWTPEEVEEQVLTPLSTRSIMGTAESDPISIMCYQLPGTIMKDGKPVTGGNDINPKDFAFAASLYPVGDSVVTPRAAPAPASAAPPRERAPNEDIDTFQIVVMDEFHPERNDGVPNGRRLSPKFAQVFATYAGARVTATMQLRADKGEPPTRFGQIIRMHERIKVYTNHGTGSLPQGDELMEFGSALFEVLLQGDVRRLYDEARTRQRQRRLDLVLTSMIPWIAEKPWEFAYDSGRKSFLATEELHFVRNVLTNVPSDPIVPCAGPLHILVASAQPVGFGLLSVDQESEVIRRGFAPLVDAGLIEIEVLPRTTPERLHGYLMTGSYQVVHFIGHGVYDEDRKEGCLIFESDTGGEYPLGEREVREIFRGRGLGLVFLNACESGRGGRADFNKGIAQSLVAAGLPALVANQYSVLDSSATSFAKHFYWSLAQGVSLGQAAREARIAVNYALRGELIDWAIPVLYARDASMALCSTPATRSRTPVTAVRPASRRAIVSRPVRVGVWDVDDVFPALERTLEVMNAAQTTFGFELVDTSVPLDVWDLTSPGETRYLWADKLAHRLASKPVALGVDVLACVTRHALRDDEWLDLYGWWPENGKPPILIFSAAGLEQLQPEGLETDRVIANSMVTGLAGFYGKLGAHDQPRKHCPMWFNPDRDFTHIAGPQQFDATCRKHLRQTLGGKLSALESILRLFA